MDPTATVSAILEHLEAGNYDEARWAAEDLGWWIHGGGSLPDFNRLTEREKVMVWELLVSTITQVTHPERN